MVRGWHPLSSTPVSVAYIQGAAKDGEPAPTLAWLHAHPPDRAAR